MKQFVRRTSGGGGAKIAGPFEMNRRVAPCPAGLRSATPGILRETGLPRALERDHVRGRHAVRSGLDPKHRRRPPAASLGRYINHRPQSPIRHAAVREKCTSKGRSAGAYFRIHAANISTVPSSAPVLHAFEAADLNAGDWLSGRLTLSK